MGHYDDAGTCVYCDYVREGLRVRTPLCDYNDETPTPLKLL